MTGGSPGRSGERWIAEEQAALRRVAVLVARAAPPEEVFAAVAAEAGRVLAADVTGISRYDPDGTAATVAGELAQRLEGAVAEVNGVLEELREIARGIHPAVLTESGLRPALRALARRSAVPVSLDVQVAGRLPEPVEIAAYYAVSEALTNVAKYAHASAAEVEVAVGDGVLRVDVRDDGRGGADFGRGSGLLGLKDRVEALGGWISLQSPAGAGTIMQIALPLDDPSRPGWPTGGSPDEPGHGPG